jgi:hypothetical protein
MHSGDSFENKKHSTKGSISAWTDYRLYIKPYKK